MTTATEEPIVSTDRAATSLGTGTFPVGHLEQLDLNDGLIFYDEEHYGRKLEERRLNILRADWNLQKAGAVMVSRRRNPNRRVQGPVMYVIDGHHRVITAKEKGEAFLPALVWDGLSLQQEAALYAAFGSVLRQSAMQVFRARLMANDSQALHLNTIINDAGFALGFAGATVKPEFRLNNVAMLEQFYRRYNGQHLFNTLGLLDQVFPGEPRRTRDPVIRALSLMLRYYGQDMNKERLAARVADKGFLALSTEANGYAHTFNVPVYQGFGQQLINAYNKYGGYTLPNWADRVPAKDVSPNGREVLRTKAIGNKWATGHGSPKRKHVAAAVKPKRHAAGTAGKRVVYNGRVEDPLARPD